MMDIITSENAKMPFQKRELALEAIVMVRGVEGVPACVRGIEGVSACVRGVEGVPACVRSIRCASLCEGA